MSNKQFFSSLKLIALKELLDTNEDKTLEILKTFTCIKNPDVHDFLHDPQKAIRSENNKTTATYLYIDDNLNLIAYYTIALKVLHTDKIRSKSLIKKLDGVDKTRETIPCYLIAQLGKDSNCEYKIGQYLLDSAILNIKKSADIVGGRFMLLDSFNNKKVIDFYTSSETRFKQLVEPESNANNVTLFYLLY